ncbi:MAG: P-II family nitrogen regulator [Chloroflexota bacterium]|jgi:nitrogen regulatory protein PII
MPNRDSESPYKLIWVIVNVGVGSKVIRKAKQYGIKGGTAFMGRGTVSDHILSLLGITDVRKEIVLLGSDGATADCVLDVLDKEFQFEKPNHGIAFTTSVCNITGTRLIKCDETAEGRGVDDAVYRIVTVIVDKGKAEQVIEAATKAGSRGGTVVNARGSGIHETKKLFSMDIEPEKEIVMILSKKEKTAGIVASIKDHLKMDQPGNGIIFTQDVNEAYGLFE